MTSESLPQSRTNLKRSEMQEPQERQVTFKDYIRVLYRGRWIIVISFFAVVLSTAYFTFTMEPVYEASAKIMIEEEGGVGENLFELTSFMKKETMINNQVEIHLKGSINEQTEFPEVKIEQSELVSIDCRDISHINSLGIQKWVLFMGALRNQNRNDHHYDYLQYARLLNKHLDDVL